MLLACAVLKNDPVSTQMFALKEVERTSSSVEECEMIRREAAILASISHPRVPHVAEFVETDEHLYLLIPAYMGGDLLDKLLSTPGNFFDEQTAIKVIRSFLGGGARIHACSHLPSWPMEPELVIAPLLEHSSTQPHPIHS